jgi:hypothetical protein
MIGGSTVIRRAVFVACVLVFGGCAGKGAEGTCADATGMCGGVPGDPMGVWNVCGFCSYDADMPNRPMSLTELTNRPQNPSIAPLQAQPTTDGSWCSDLILNPASGTTPSQVTSVNLWHGLASVNRANAGTVTLRSDGTYEVDLNFVEKAATTHFTPFCLQFQGQVQIDCPLLATQISAFYMTMAGAHPVAFQNISCQPATDDGGCDCFYDYSVAVTDTGTWLKSGNLLQESSGQYLYNGQPVMSQAPELSMVATFCQSGNTLTLSGYDGTTLSSVPGLRTLSLTRM